MLPGGGGVWTFDAQGNQGRVANLRGEVLPLLWLRRNLRASSGEVRQSVVCGTVRRT
ncbi:hypothetical protein CCP3SC15_720012 [Gammaproteobacteria bacterium]